MTPSTSNGRRLRFLRSALSVSLCLCGSIAFAADRPVSLKQLLAEQRVAAAAGRHDDLTRVNGELSKLAELLPPWVAEKRDAASAVPAAKQRIVMMWSRLHQKAVDQAAAGDRDKALDAAAQALTVARDNLGEGHIATIIAATDLASLQLQAGQVEAAEAGFARAVAAASLALGTGHPETLRIRGLLAGLQSQQARYGDAIATLDLNARAAADSLGPGHAQTLSAMLALARAQVNSGRLAEAATTLTAACTASDHVYGEAHPETARCLTEQGSLARRRGEIPAAAELLEHARDAERLALADTDPVSLSTRLELGGVRQAQGRLDEAKAELESVARDAGESPTALAAKSDLVDVLADRDELEAAEKLAGEVLAKQTATLGNAHPDTVATLGSLAAIYRKQGRLFEAEKTFADAYALSRKVLGDNHPSTIVAANNLGEILEKEGIYERAEPLLRAAVDGSRVAWGDEHPATLAAENNLALLYESQGVFAKAEPLYQSVIAVRAKAAGPRNPDTIATTNNLAYLYLLERDYAKAAPMFAQVTEAWKKAYGPRHQNTLKALNNLARATFGAGDAAAAEKLFDQALSLRRAALGPTHMDTLRSMHDLARLYAATGREQQAESLLRETLAGDEAALGPDHPYTFETLNSLAAVQESRGDTAGAYQTLHTVFTRRNAFFGRVLPVTGDNAREGYIRLHAPELAAYVGVLARQDAATAGRGVLEASVARKGLLLQVASEIQQIRRLSRDPELARVGDELAAVRKKLAALTLSGPTAETGARHLEIVAGLEERINVLQGELGRASVRFKHTVAPVGLDEVVKALPDEAALVDFLVTGEGAGRRLVAAVLRKDGGRAVFDLVRYPDLAAIEAAVVKYRTDIQNEDIDLDDLLDSGQAATKLVWAPLAKTLGGRTDVYLVPDGMLNILPFSALVEDDRKYLMERVDLHLLGSSRDLVPSPLPAAKGGTLINAGPDYNTDEVTGKDTLEKARRRSATDIQSSLRGMASGLRGLHFDPLPGAEREGQLIAKTVEDGGRPTTIVSKAAAQEKVLREQETPPEVLHIATHGFFLKADDTLRRRLLSLQRSGDIQMPPPGDNPLLRAGLAFAGINSNAQVLGEIDTDNDGVLTALEVLGLDLTGTRLAILSACETGLGEIHEGEGVYGLRRAFQQAGARSVVSSLWEVSDAGTQTLMAALYKRLLAGMGPHQALREAQLEMLRDSQWSMPYVWSAFFMVEG